MAIGNIVFAVIGVVMALSGLSSIYLSRTASHEDLQLGPFRRVFDFFDATENTKYRRLFWTSIGLVSMLTGLAFFQLALAL